MEVSGPGFESELQLKPAPQPQQHQIQAPSANYAAAYGNTGSLTHWVRPGIEPASSQRQHQVLHPLSTMGAETPFFFFMIFIFFCYSWFTVFCQFSALQHGDPVTHIWTHFFSHIIMLHRKWLDIVPSAIQPDLIPYPAGSHCFATPKAIVCIDTTTVCIPGAISSADWP